MKSLFKLISVMVGLFLSFTPITSFGVTPRPSTLDAATITISDAFVTSMGAHEPFVSDMLIQTFGKQGYTYYDLMAQMGYVSTFSTTWQTNFSHFEEGYYTDYILVNSNVADPGANNPISIPVNASQVVSGQIYARVGDQVINPNTGAYGLVYGITGTSPNFSIEVQPTQQGATFGAVNLGDEIFIYSNTFPEGTDQPASRADQVTQFTFNTKIMKETVTATGSENTNKNWFKIESMNSWIYLSKGIWDCEYRLKQWISGAALLDQTITTTSGNLGGQRAMNGLLNQITNYGYTQPYTGGTWSINDMYTMGKIQYKNFAGHEFFLFDGVDLGIEIDQAIGGIFNANPTIFSKRNGNWGYDNTKDVDLGFKSLTLAGMGITYHLHDMTCFSHPKMYGLPGYQFEGLGVVLPNSQNTDPVLKTDVPTITFRHKELDGISRKQLTWWTGAAGAPMYFVPNTTVDISQYNMLTEMGIEIYAANQMYQILRTS